MRVFFTLLTACLLAFGATTQAAPADTTTVKEANVRPKSRYRRPAKALRPLYKRKKVHHGHPLAQ